MTISLRPLISSDSSVNPKYLVKDMKGVVDRYINVVGYVSASLSNPQGDIDNENAPRQNPFNLKGIITHQGIKRKIRDLLVDVMGQPVHVARGSVLLQGTLDAMEVLKAGEKSTKALRTFVDKTKIPKGKKGKKNATSAEGAPEGSADNGNSEDDDNDLKKDGPEVCTVLTTHFTDDRLFGRLVLSPYNVGLKGPVQIENLQSLHPIEILDLTIGCTAVANYADANEGKDRTIGHSKVVDFGLYQMNIKINPVEAKKTGMTWEDLNTFLNLLTMIWDLTVSSSRSGVAHEKAYIFIHESLQTSAPIPELVRLVTPGDKGLELEKDAPRNSMENYDMVDLSKVKIPEGVTAFDI